MPRHPVHELLSHAAYAGRDVTAVELDELKLAPADRERVLKAASEAARVHAEGEQGQAHELALQSALSIVADLPDEQRDADYLAEPEKLDGLSPIEMAAKVPRIY